MIPRATACNTAVLPAAQATTPQAVVVAVPGTTARTPTQTTTATEMSPSGSVPGDYPARFRSAPERSRRIARPLRRVARVKTDDEELLHEIGRRLRTRDELGAQLAGAMRIRDRDDPERVTFAQLRQALNHGIGAVDDPPPALARFFAVVDAVPEWVDFDQVERGARIMREMGRSVDDVMLQLALIGGYRFGGPPDLLVATGGLVGATAMRRLGETQKWALSVLEPNGMRRTGAGFVATVHVRVMHALVNHEFETNGRWDVDRWGLPINQTDASATLGLFNSTLLLGIRALGWIVTADQSRAVMHLWKYVGWLMGVDEDWLFDTEQEQNRHNYHLVLVQAEPTSAGPALARALVEGQLTRDRGRLTALRNRYERARLLSMLRYFLGAQGLRDLGLPSAVPWAVPPIVAANLVRSGLLVRAAAGRRYLERASGRFARRNQRAMFGAATPEVGALPS
ncbi:hypothetical protein (DUF2236) [Parafrankia irregularis]|uniref:ER-bound oxygenase mpaB/mpaB'/Rubber oxygenase catalytic domain-containing protein n=1 Tax=Parafrankia irregularis TaxID=795642 RepID=A0A0S4QQP3_9ACTN|nr:MULTISPECIES: oxygenase MpaB family protein [Parafrankia]MBE3199888.1 DUF2236 domain-containing protein [Parafrankia sp. CH37]CUU58043.1 hypothetical protein (DUF2236) [Parafrankia irregularis]